MMIDIAIQVSELSKKYKLYNKPIDRLKEALNPYSRSYHEEFYALENVSFTIKKGETVGIVGSNGAGKSTLLKIITGVLTPTSGNVRTYGRISSLLELGAGFNPEMSGLENVYLQGAIQGYSKAEMKLRVDDILRFSEVEDFIHQPVKSYSSGMFARLAFAVAINVKPEILIVDEALSVGDAKFQRKCFAKFDELKNQGVTIIYVSHDLDSIKTFTERALFICDGKLMFDGNSKECIIQYLKHSFGNMTTENNYLQVDVVNREKRH